MNQTQPLKCVKQVVDRARVNLKLNSKDRKNKNNIYLMFLNEYKNSIVYT